MSQDSQFLLGATEQGVSGLPGLGAKCNGHKGQRIYTEWATQSLLNGCQRFAEVGEDGIDLRANETLELIDDFKRFQIDHHQANFDRFYLIRYDCKRPGCFPLPTSSQVASRSTQYR